MIDTVDAGIRPTVQEVKTLPQEVNSVQIPQEQVSRQAERFQAIGGLLQAVEENLLTQKPEDLANWRDEQIDATTEEIARHLSGRGNSADNELVGGAETILKRFVRQENGIQQIWEEQNLDQPEKARQQAGKWLESAYRKVSANSEANFSEESMEDIAMHRVVGGVAITNIPTDVFTAIAVKSMSENGETVDDSNIVDTLRDMPGVGLTVPINEFLPEDSIPKGLENGYVVLVKEGLPSSMETVLQHEVQGEIVGALMQGAQQDISLLARYGELFLSDRKVPGMKDPIVGKAISDLAARTAEGDLDIRLGSLGITPEFVNEYPEAAGTLDRLVQIAREKINFTTAEQRKEFSRLVLGGITNPVRLLEFLDPEGKVKQTTSADLLKNDISLNSNFTEGRFVHTKATLKRGDSLQGGNGKMYKIEDVIGKGGFGVVYRASVNGSGQQVLIKEIVFQDAWHSHIDQLSSPASAIALFDTEKQQVNQNDPNAIVRHFEAVLGNGLFKIFQDHLNKSTQDASIVKQGLSPAQFVVRGTMTQAQIDNLFRQAFSTLHSDRDFQELQKDVRHHDVTFDIEIGATNIMKGVPGVPAIYEVVRNSNSLNNAHVGYKVRYMVEQFIEGNNFYPVPKVSLGEALAIVMPLLTPLKIAHAKGLTHQDVKPENIMKDANGEVMLIDWGNAKGGNLPAWTGPLGLGTRDYAPPEQIGNNSVPATDVYALGVFTYQLLTGEEPYIDAQGNNFTRLTDMEIKNKLVTQNNIPNAIADVILRCLHLDKNQRFQNAGQMQQALMLALKTPTLDLNNEDTVARRHVGASSQIFSVSNLPANITVIVSPSEVGSRLSHGDLPEAIVADLEGLVNHNWRTLGTNGFIPLAAAQGFKEVVSAQTSAYGERKIDWFAGWWKALEAVSKTREGRSTVIGIAHPELQQATGDFFTQLQDQISHHPSDMYLILPMLTQIIQNNWQNSFLEGNKGTYVARLLGEIVVQNKIQLDQRQSAQLADLWEKAVATSYEYSDTTNPPVFMGRFVNFINRANLPDTQQRIARLKTQARDPKIKKALP